jgi:hypothetical protein
MNGNKIGDFRRKIYKFYEQDILNEKQYQELLDSFEAAISVTRCSLKLEEKHKTDFDVWAISKGYTKMEGEYVKEPEVYNYEFLLQLYNEQN